MRWFKNIFIHHILLKFFYSLINNFPKNIFYLYFLSVIVVVLLENSNIQFYMNIFHNQICLLHKIIDKLKSTFLSLTILSLKLTRAYFVLY